MPESVKDRPGRAHEYVFQLAKSERYFYDADAVKEPSTWAGQERTSRAPAASHVPGAPAHRGIRRDEPTGSRNLRSVWTITPTPFEGAHFATFPPELARRCVLAGSAPGDTVLDPFSGSGTTGAVATGNGRSYVGLELNPDYAEMSRDRIGGLITKIERAA
jgi:DNA modification methylase